MWVCNVLLPNLWSRVYFERFSELTEYDFSFTMALTPVTNYQKPLNLYNTSLIKCTGGPQQSQPVLDFQNERFWNCNYLVGGGGREHSLSVAYITYNLNTNFN